MIKQLLSCVREYKREAILTPVFVSLEVLFECLIPFIIANLVNEIQAGCGLETIVKNGAVLIVLAVLSLVCGLLSGAVCATASAGFAKNLRHDLFYKVQEFSFENIDRFETSSLVTRLTTDVTNIQNAFMMLIRVGIRTPLMMIFACTMAVIMGGRLALVFVFVIPVLFVGLLIIGLRVLPLFRRVFRKYDAINESIQENIHGMRVVKSFVREQHETEKFTRASDDVRRDFTRAEKILALNSPLMQFCMYTVMIFVMTMGPYMIITSNGLDINVGELSSMLSYNYQVLSSLMTLAMIVVMMTMAVESARRACEILSEESTLKNPENPVFEVKDGSIDFDDVSFRYAKTAKRDTLSDVNLHIKSGETIGIIGGTGSSKSTLVQLVCRLYDVTEGTLRVGGVDVRDYDLDTLRNSVAVVLQKNVLFSGTIRDNMRWGDKNATDEEIIHALELANAMEFVSQMPDGLDTHIEQGGANVSGGQKQRLCIARALLKKPKILILDDSTSAVDTHTDAMIRKSFSEYIPETTKLIIAQRISSVQDSDRIIILDGGRIDDVGTHDELLERSKIYSEVFYSQTRSGDFDAQ